MSDNPFESPNLSDAPVPSRPTGGSRTLEDARFTPVMDMYVQSMRPWLKFMGVIGMILAVLVGVGAVFVALAGMLSAVSGNPSGAFMAFASLLYVLIGAIYAYPAWQLLQSSSRAQRALTAEDGEDKELMIEEFFRHQQNLWRFMGILTLVIVGLYALIFVVACVGAFGGIMANGNF